MTPRPATPQDAAELARIHAASWRETYPGLLPTGEIDRMTQPDRCLDRWQAILSNPALQVAMVEGLGFAVSGPQRDAALREAGFPQELWSIHLLQCGQRRGLGRALLTAVAGPQAFTALVLEGNLPARRFYAAMGGLLHATRPDRIGETEIIERVYAWPNGCRALPTKR